MKTPPTLPAAIEIFRAGRHIDDAGVAHEFSEADVRGMVTAYKPSLREAPLTVGHPKDNLPAYGYVKSLGVNADGRLTMDAHQVEPQFAEMVQAGRFKKRSASFYPPSHPNNPTPGAWYLRHVAFLGAQPPAIAGLKDIQFADDATGTVSFSEAEITQESNVTEQELKEARERAEKAEAEAKTALLHTQEAKAALDDANKKLAQFAEAQRVERTAGFVSFAEGEVKAGRLLPKDQAAAVAVLNTLADTQVVEFAEGDATKKVSPVEWLKTLISSGKTVVEFGEHAPGNSGAGGQGIKGKSDAEIDRMAKDYAHKHNVNYAEALTAIAKFTS